MSRDVPAPHFQNLKVKSNDSSSSLDRQRTTYSVNPSDATLRPPSALIVGGSIGGCCAAISLASIDCPVTILERTPGQLPAQGAGLVIQPDMADFLLEFKVCTSLSDLSFKSSGRQYVDKQGQIIGGDDVPQLFSAWDVLYRALRAPVPDKAYRAGCTVQSVKHLPTATNVIEDSSNAYTTSASEGKLSGTKKTTTTTNYYEITLKNSEEKLTADLLIGADGPGSLVRSHFLPNERSEYQGYVAWRGVLEESEASQNVLSFLGQKFTVYQGDNFHILCYLIPGSNGEIDPGKRRVNWVWYLNHHSGESLSEILTDVNGKVHGFSVPKGFLKPEIAENLKRKSRDMLPAALSEIVCATPEIFLQAIHDYLAPKLVFHDSAVLLGDAGCILRPHTAAGTTKAAVNAWALADCLKDCGFHLTPALKKYNASMLELGRELVKVGVEIGTKSQFPNELSRNESNIQ